MTLQSCSLLKCDNLYDQKNKFIEVCPFCGNENTQKTVDIYLRKAICIKLFMGEDK